MSASVDAEVDAVLSKVVENLSIESTSTQPNNQFDPASQTHSDYNQSVTHLSNQSNTQSRVRLPISVEEFVRDSINQSSRTGLVYDARCALHSCNYAHVEQPSRITESFKQLTHDGLIDRLVWLQSRPATDAELLSTHSTDHINFLVSTATHEYKDAEPDSESDDLSILYEDCVTIDGDTFANKYSNQSLRLAAGGCIDLIDLLYNHQLSNAFALIRPPGHHSCMDRASGFCLVNNVAVGINCLIKRSPKARVAIVDWDVHHGDGTQALFYSSHQVLYISLHRHDKGMFYPGTGAVHEQGVKDGLGYNVNISLNSKCGDIEYEQVFDDVIVPILTQYAPDVLVVSAGFDCARGDPLGGMDVTPDGFARLTKKMMSIPRSASQSDDSKRPNQSITQSPHAPVLIALEGGYNVPVVAQSISKCVSMLLGDNQSSNKPVSQSTTPVSNRTRGAKIARKTQFQQDLDDAIKAHSKYWKLGKQPVIDQHVAQPFNQSINQTDNQSTSADQSNFSQPTFTDALVEVTVQLKEELIITEIVPVATAESL